MNFGAFLGGVAQGFDLNRMLTNSEKVKKLQDEARLEVIRSKGLADAAKSREDEISKLITENKTEAPVSDSVKPSTSGAPVEERQWKTRELPPVEERQWKTRQPAAQEESVDLSSIYEPLPHSKMPAAQPASSRAPAAAASDPAQSSGVQTFAVPNAYSEEGEKVVYSGQPGAKIDATLPNQPKAPQAFSIYRDNEKEGTGLLADGNIDLNSRKILKNPDGSISTESSIGIEVDGKYYLIPTVIAGQRVSDDDAVAYFKKTGEHLGVFDSQETADQYAKQLHERQQAFYTLEDNAEKPVEPAAPTEQPVAAVQQAAPVAPPVGPASGMPAMPAQAAPAEPAPAAAVPPQAAAPAPAQATAPAPVPAAAAPAPAQAAPAAAAPEQTGAIAPQAAPAQDPAPAAAPAAASPTQQAVGKTGMAGAAPEAPKVAGRFVVNGQGYATMDEARKAAEALVPSKMEIFRRNVTPKISEEYVRQGQPEKAEAWEKWAEAKRGQDIMRAYARVTTAPDLESMAREGMKLYSYVNDGYDAVGEPKIVTKADGTQVAVVQIRAGANGKTSELEFTKDSIMRMAASANPQAMFEFDRQQAADAAKLKLQLGIKAQERAAKREDDRAIEKYKSDLRKEENTEKGQQRLSEITLRNQLKKDLGENGADGYRKATSPEERAAIIDKQYKDDPAYRKLTPEQKRQFIADKIKSYEEIGAEARTRRGEGGAAPAQAGAKPGAAAAPAAMPDGTVLRNKSTGELFIMKGGQRVPYGGSKPAAAPAPAAPSAPAAPAAAPAAPQGQAPAKPAAAAAQGMPVRPAPTQAPQTAIDPLVSQIQEQRDPTLRQSHFQSYANIQTNMVKLNKLNEMFRKAATMGDQASVEKLRAEIGALQGAIKRDQEVLGRFYRVPGN